MKTHISLSIKYNFSILLATDSKFLSVEDLKILNMSDSSVTVTWQTPTSNDALEGYVVRYSVIAADDNTLHDNVIDKTLHGNYTVTVYENVSLKNISICIAPAFNSSYGNESCLDLLFNPVGEWNTCASYVHL
jgi:hypothetical protein